MENISSLSFDALKKFFEQSKVIFCRKLPPSTQVFRHGHGWKTALSKDTRVVPARRMSGVRRDHHKNVCQIWHRHQRKRTLFLLIDASREVRHRPFQDFERLVRSLARRNHRARLLMSVPSVGVLVSLTYALPIDDPHRFKRSRHVGAPIGRTPKRYPYGEKDVGGHISKMDVKCSVASKDDHTFLDRPTCSSSYPIRWRPSANHGQKRNRQQDRNSKRGLINQRPLQNSVSPSIDVGANPLPHPTWLTSLGWLGLIRWYRLMHGFQITGKGSSRRQRRRRLGRRLGVRLDWSGGCRIRPGRRRNQRQVNRERRALAHGR